MNFESLGVVEFISNHCILDIILLISLKTTTDVGLKPVFDRVSEIPTWALSAQPASLRATKPRSETALRVVLSQFEPCRGNQLLVETGPLTQKNNSDTTNVGKCSGDTHLVSSCNEMIHPLCFAEFWGCLLKFLLL